MSANLAAKIQLGLDELAVIRGMMSPLIARTGESELPVMETAAACTMLHSFYTEIEKILKLIALDLDKKIPSSESWHRDLLSQMAADGNAATRYQRHSRYSSGRTVGISPSVSRRVDCLDALG